jgi:hypothetical protein
MKTHALTGLKSLQEESLEAVQRRIRVRAYQLYERRRREDGHDLDDWLQAETEEVQRRNKMAA